MMALSYQIHLLSPLLAAQLSAGEENSSKSFNFIPGSMLRGALINLYLRERKAHGKEAGDPAIDPDCRRLFFGGTNCYLNAYPVDYNLYRTIPKPLSWYMDKEELDDNHDRGTIYDFAIEKKSFRRFRSCPEEFYSLYENDGNAYPVKTSSSLSMHNANEKRLVRLRDRSAVFRYEAIAAGQIFGGVIVSKNKEDLELLKSMMENRQIAIGGSRSAGYGQIVFREIEISSEWSEYRENSQQEGGLVVLTLLSDMICRDKNGHYTTNLDEILNCKHVRAYQAIRITGGFNRKWGLPLVQVPAIQAGSVFVYRAGDIDEDLLNKYRAEGIGERREEGFGRIAVNLNMHETLVKGVENKPYPPPPVKPLSDDSKELAGRLAVRRLRKILDRQLLAAIGRLDIICFPPGKAQLNRLREVVKQAWWQGKPKIIIGYLNDLSKTAAIQFEHARVRDIRFSNWLRAGIEEEKIWENYFGIELKPVSVAGIKAEVTTKIKFEYTARLLEALLKKTVKKLQEEGAL